MGILNWPLNSSDEKYVATENSLPLRDASRQGRQTWIGNWATELLELASCAIMRRSRNDANLLVHRMVALGLDPCELRLLDPALAHHMQSQCSRCGSREQCLQDLASGSSGSASRNCEDWRNYCPNALALEMLSALQSRSR